MSNLPLLNPVVKLILAKTAQERRIMPHNITRKRKKPGIKAIKTIKAAGLMLLFQGLQKMSSRLASLMAYHLWFHPGRASARGYADFTPEGQRQEQFRLNNKRVYYWCAGANDGETVFLMHGWAGSGNQMGPLARALLDQGYRVVCLDAPAHGRSSGWQTNLFEIADAINKVQQREGPFKAILAHSFGVPCSLYAMHYQCVQADRFIAISSPARFDNLLNSFCNLLRANPQTRDGFERRFAQLLGDKDMNDIAPLTLAKNVYQPCLVIHDKHDRVVRSDDGKLLKQALVNGRLLLTEKLGHSRLLADNGVIQRIGEFLNETELETEDSIRMVG